MNHCGRPFLLRPGWPLSWPLFRSCRSQFDAVVTRHGFQARIQPNRWCTYIQHVLPTAEDGSTRTKCKKLETVGRPAGFDGQARSGPAVVKNPSRKTMRMMGRLREEPGPSDRPTVLSRTNQVAMQGSQRNRWSLDGRMDGVGSSEEKIGEKETGQEISSLGSRWQKSCPVIPQTKLAKQPSKRPAPIRRNGQDD